MMFSRYALTLVFFACLVSACDSSQDQVQQLSNQDLRTQWRDCIYASSEEQPHACQRYEEECQLRKEQENFACY